MRLTRLATLSPSRHVAGFSGRQKAVVSPRSRSLHGHMFKVMCSPARCKQASFSARSAHSQLRSMRPLRICVHLALPTSLLCCVASHASVLAVAVGPNAALCRWANRESELQQMPGFKAFLMCRRDGLKADDGFTYQSTTVWQDRLSFENWTQSQQFASAHKDVKPEVRRGTCFASAVAAGEHVSPLQLLEEARFANRDKHGILQGRPVFAEQEARRGHVQRPAVASVLRGRPDARDASGRMSGTAGPLLKPSSTGCTPWHADRLGACLPRRTVLLTSWARGIWVRRPT